MLAGYFKIIYMEKFRDLLKELEQKKNVSILYACETGSRAWGFPSPDSDYDIRFIYAHEKDWYLSLTPKKDTIEFMSGDLDITGWDLKKSLLLIAKSNAALIERFQSPIVYYEKDDFRTRFRGLIHECYSETAVFYHHYSQAAKFMEEIDSTEKVKLKSFFYLLRSLLSCYWIHMNHRVLPMHLEGLLEYVKDDFKEEIRSLVKLKSEKEEKYLHDKNLLPMDSLKGIFNSLSELKTGLRVSKPDYEMLYRFFLKAL
jgi:uncharacterized protein